MNLYIMDESANMIMHVTDAPCIPRAGELINNSDGTLYTVVQLEYEINSVGAALEGVLCRTVNIIVREVKQ